MFSFTPYILYWIDSSFRVEIQNQPTAWIVKGHDFVITGDGWKPGVIDANGKALIARAAGHSNQFGRLILP